MQRLLINTIPCSGTNMLVQIVRAEWHIRRYEDAVGGKPKSADAIQSDIWNSFRPLERRCVGHIIWTAGIEFLINEMQIKTIFLYRDPRDIVVSHMFHAKKYHASSALNFNIKGTLLHARRDPLMDLIKGLGARLAEFTPWLKRAKEEGYEKILPMRYEDFRNQPVATCFKMSKFAPEIFKNETASTLVDRIKPASSPTFRKGIVGDWKNHLKTKHIKEFWSDTSIVEAMKVMGYNNK